MTKKLLSLFLFLLLVLFGYAQEDNFLFNDIVVDKSLGQSIYPSKAVREGISKGGVDIIVEVDPQGHIADFLVLASTNDAFISNALMSIQSYQYTPAMLDGKPIWMSKVIRINFEIEGIVSPSNPAKEIDEKMRLKGSMDWTKTFCTLKELDKIPQPLEVVTPQYPETLNKEKFDGLVVVKFYIDMNGKVRTPKIMSMSHPAFAESVIKALHQWRFEPPMRDGKPVLVEAMQPFEFNYQEKD